MRGNLIEHIRVYLMLYGQNLVHAEYFLPSPYANSFPKCLKNEMWEPRRGRKKLQYQQSLFLFKKKCFGLCCRIIVSYPVALLQGVIIQYFLSVLPNATHWPICPLIRNNCSAGSLRGCVAYIMGLCILFMQLCSSKP